MKKITFIILSLFIVIVAGAMLYGFLVEEKNEPVSEKIQEGEELFSSLLPSNNSTTLQPKDVIDPRSRTNENSQDIGTPLSEEVIAKNSENKTTFSLEKVTTHNIPNDCYLVINNNVYDVSSYLGMHPGGKRSITSRCGTEVTGIFARIHSNFAWDLLKNYKIGTIDTVSVSENHPVYSTLTLVTQLLAQKYPGAEIVNVKPLQDFFIGKIIYQNKFYEIHVDSKGKILKEEVADDEADWNAWDTDADDQ